MGAGGKRVQLTELQEQGLKRLEAEGLTIRAYAKRQQLSEQQLYQMTKVLRAKGVLAPSRWPRLARGPTMHSGPTPRRPSGCGSAAVGIL